MSHLDKVGKGGVKKNRNKDSIIYLLNSNSKFWKGIQKVLAVSAAFACQEESCGWILTQSLESSHEQNPSK